MSLEETFPWSRVVSSSLLAKMFCIVKDSLWSSKIGFKLWKNSTKFVTLAQFRLFCVMPKFRIDVRRKVLSKTLLMKRFRSVLSKVNKLMFDRSDRRNFETFDRMTYPSVTVRKWTIHWKQSPCSMIISVWSAVVAAFAAIASLCIFHYQTPSRYLKPVFWGDCRSATIWSRILRQLLHWPYYDVLFIRFLSSKVQSPFIMAIGTSIRSQGLEFGRPPQFFVALLHAWWCCLLCSIKATTVKCLQQSGTF